MRAFDGPILFFIWSRKKSEEKGREHWDKFYTLWLGAFANLPFLRTKGDSIGMLTGSDEEEESCVLEKFCFR